jgi:hypothetical protein
LVFREEFNKVNERMLLSKNPIPLYEIDENSEELFDKYNIVEFPTAILFYNGE